MYLYNIYNTCVSATSILFLVDIYCMLYIGPCRHRIKSKAKSGRGNGVPTERAQLCPVTILLLHSSGCQAQSPPRTEGLGEGKYVGVAAAVQGLGDGCSWGWVGGGVEPGSRWGAGGVQVGRGSSRTQALSSPGLGGSEDWGRRASHVWTSSRGIHLCS